jgi:hypothetical protein
MKAIACPSPPYLTASLHPGQSAQQFRFLVPSIQPTAFLHHITAILQGQSYTRCFKLSGADMAMSARIMLSLKNFLALSMMLKSQPISIRKHHHPRLETESQPLSQQLCRSNGQVMKLTSLHQSFLKNRRSYRRVRMGLEPTDWNLRQTQMQNIQSPLNRDGQE